MASSRHAALEALPDLVLRQVAADEHHAAHPLLALAPLALVIAIEDHVHALQHEPRVVVLERQDALAAQDVRPFLLDQVLHPGKELVGVERLLGRKRDRLHLLVVIVLEAAMVVGVIVSMAVLMLMAVLMIMMVIVSVTVLVMFGLKKL